MRLTALAPLAPPILGVPAVLYGALPSWCLAVLVGVSVLLTATQVIVTQIIRLASAPQSPAAKTPYRYCKSKTSPTNRQAVGPPAWEVISHTGTSAQAPEYWPT